MVDFQGTVADYLLKMLAEVGVKRIYGVAGSAIFPLLDAISKQTQVSFIATANEMSAAYMAAYEARLTGNLGVCTGGSGPGTVSLANGLADAYFEGDPVLAITGQVKVKDVGTRTKQYFDQVDFYRPLTGFSEEMLQAEAVPRTLPRAISIALTQRTAVQLTVPKDVFTQTLQVNQPPLRWYPLENLSGNLEKAIDLMQRFSRPVMVLGKEAISTVEHWLEIAEILGAAVVVAQEIKGLVTLDHPLNLGGIGETYLPELLKDADGIILIGSAQFEQPFLPKVSTIQVTRKTMDLDWSLPLVEPITGNLSFLAKAISRRLEPRTESQWRQRVEESRRDLQNQLTQEAEQSGKPIHPSKLMSTLSLYLSEDAIITLDTGGFIHWFDKSFWAKHQTVLASAYWRGMGSALPAAIAAKLAYPKRDVVAVLGDGGLMLNPGELITAARNKLRILVIVVNTSSYELEVQKMKKEGASTLGADLPPWNLRLFAESCGALGLEVAETTDLDQVLLQALKHQGPVLVDVKSMTPDLPNLLVD